MNEDVCCCGLVFSKKREGHSFIVDGETWCLYRPDHNKSERATPILMSWIGRQFVDHSKNHSLKEDNSSNHDHREIIADLIHEHGVCFFGPRLFRFLWQQ